MRLQEFASAEEQMALWRLVSDSVWASIGQQAHLERQERAAKAAQAKTKRKRGNRAGSKSSSTPVPIKMPKQPNNKVATANAPTAPTAANTAPVGNAVANASTSGMYKNGSNTNAANKIAANSNVAMAPTTAAQPSPAFSPAHPATPTVPAPATPSTQKASSGSQDAFNWRNTPIQKKLPAATDRHSANTYRTQTVHPSARGAITR